MTLSYDDFAKINILSGTIVKAEISIELVNLPTKSWRFWPRSGDFTNVCSSDRSLYA